MIGRGWARIATLAVVGAALGTLPALGSVKVLVQLILDRAEGTDNDAYADNLSLTGV